MRPNGLMMLLSALLLLALGPAPRPALASPLQVAPLDALPGLLERLGPQVSEAIGRRIWRNEAALRVDWLVHWLPGEAHASLGIGHFIWYPEGRRGPYQESFPRLLAFLEAHHVRLPLWLTPTTPNPWPDRAAFVAAAADDPRIAGLRQLLVATVPSQLAFMAHRLAAGVPALLATVPPDRRNQLQEQVERVLMADDGSLSPGGVYALIDYVNFKGEGTDPEENYRGQGWGLLQVLLTMQGLPGDGRAAFAEAAARVLEQRVALAPEGSHEERWLAGWRKRVRSYATFALVSDPQAPAIHDRSERRQAAAPPGGPPFR